MDMDEVDMHIPYPDLAAFAFGNFALARLAAFESGDAKMEERRSGAMVNFMLDV